MLLILAAFIFLFDPHQISFITIEATVTFANSLVEPGCQIFPRGIRGNIHKSCIDTDPCSSWAHVIFSFYATLAVCSVWRKLTQSRGVHFLRVRDDLLPIDRFVCFVTGQDPQAV